MEKETIFGLGLIGVGAYLLFTQPQAEEQIGGSSSGGDGFLSGLGSFAPLSTTKANDSTDATQPVYNVTVEAPDMPTGEASSGGSSGGGGSYGTRTAPTKIDAPFKSAEYNKKAVKKALIEAEPPITKGLVDRGVLPAPSWRWW